MMETLSIVLAGVTGIPSRNILRAVVAARNSRDDFSITVLRRGDIFSTDNVDEINNHSFTTAYVDYARPDTVKDALISAKADVAISALHAEKSPALNETLLQAL
jgi:hypothetical protein